MKKFFIACLFMFIGTAVFSQDYVQEIPKYYAGTYTIVSVSFDAGASWTDKEIGLCVMTPKNITLSTGQVLVPVKVATTAENGIAYLGIRVPSGATWIMCYMGDNVGFWLIQSIAPNGKEATRLICRKD